MPDPAQKRLVEKYGAGWPYVLARKMDWDDEDVALMCDHGLDVSGAHVWRRFYNMVKQRGLRPALGEQE